MMSTKHCTKCGIEKNLEEFSFMGKGKRRAQCKACIKQYNAANKERRKAYSKEYYSENTERFKAYSKEYYSENKDKKKEYYSENIDKKKEYYVANKERLKAYRKEYYSENIDKSKQYYAANKERLKASSKQYKAANKAYYNAACVKYKAKKLQRTPAWADLNKIKEIYELRRIMEIWTGVECHVDHIIPLQGELVSGLHVENNLQIISAKDNLSKKNSFKPK